MSANSVGTSWASNNLLRTYRIMQEISTNGPVMACFQVYESFFWFFQNYPTGI